MPTIFACLYAYVHAESLQLRLTLCDPMDCGPAGSSIYRIIYVRILSGHLFLKGSFWSRHRTHDSRLLHWQAGSLPLTPAGSCMHTVLC